MANADSDASTIVVTAGIETTASSGAGVNSGVQAQARKLSRKLMGHCGSRCEEKITRWWDGTCVCNRNCGCAVSGSGFVRTDELDWTITALDSANGDYQLKMQDDGNVVLYRGSNALWASNTVYNPYELLSDAMTPPFKLVMQADGNLVAYGNGNAYWSSETSYGDMFGPYTLVVQDDGNCVIYAANGSAVASTGTDQLGN